MTWKVGREGGSEGERVVIVAMILMSYLSSLITVS